MQVYYYFVFWFLINKVFSHFYYCGTACGSQLISFSTKISSNTLARHHFTGKNFSLMNKEAITQPFNRIHHKDNFRRVKFSVFHF